MSKNLSALSFRKGIEKNVFERMVDAADRAGTAEKNETVRQMGADHLFGDAVTLGAVSFYDFLKKENEGNLLIKNFLKQILILLKRVLIKQVYFSKQVLFHPLPL
jgi:CRISPR/Cas system CMR subunit Cmr6 (Cas7 group RAMP superfamily)